MDYKTTCIVSTTYGPQHTELTDGLETIFCFRLPTGTYAFVLMIYYRSTGEVRVTEVNCWIGHGRTCCEDRE
ncbi:hypothetical protein SAMN05421752_103272 [Natronorubrum thiooxidans]|uniref:Uncharacterized protein n=1 Tax=Natronorubrum thiooxidans TaxID=308853 RepID=A0A1N7E787_9EURY|nr:hypothetical protein SAMN05421752_103272 [Natronorubrum thiooxidans]